MVDLMMWLLIAALLLAAAIQGIGYYQQAAYIYQAKSDVSAANSWVSGRNAIDNALPNSAILTAAVTDGDLRTTKNGSESNTPLLSVSGAKYCIGVNSPFVKGANVFYVTSDAPNTVIRATEIPASCGTVVPGGGGPVVTDPLPSVRATTLRFGLATDNVVAGTETDATARLMDESPAFISFYKDWTLPLDVAPLNAISDKGAIPVVTWEPWSAADVNGVNQPTYKLSTITAGNHDAYIRTWAANAKAYNKPMMIRFAHEMNGNWYPWSEQVNGNAPGDYVAAWRHVVDVFEAEGATNVQWVWAPNMTTGTPLAPLYPGTAYVDNTGIDGFNWGAARGGWMMPWDVLDSTMVEIAAIAPDKNIIVTEIGTVETEGANTKATWINEAIWYLNHWNRDLSKSPTVQVTGVIWFDLNKEHDWRINSSTEAAEAMKSALNTRLTT
jgi:hypothetical protein